MTNTVGQFEMNSAADLIIGCAQTVIPSEQVDQISKLLTEPLDWEYILFTADRNGLLPLLSWNLLENFAESIPSDVHDRISTYFRSHAQENLYLALKQTEITKLLEGSGIPVLSFKGATLALRAYGDLALRKYVDLDILVQPRHFDDSVQLLLEKGYEAISTSGALKRKALFFTRKKDVRLCSPDQRVLIELHWKLSGSHFAFPFDLNQLWTRLDKLNFGGFDLNVLTFNDLFVYLCLHGSRHGWERLAWISDLHELIRSEESSGRAIDWKEVRNHAKDHGCERVLELGIFMVDRYFDFTADYPEFENIKASKIYQDIAEQVHKKAFMPTTTSSEIGDWYLLHLSLKERKTDRLRLNIVYFFWYLKLIFKPNAADRSVVHLPKVFYPLYFIMRPIRLLVNFISTFPNNRSG